ncbi:MAG: hypothetical protein PVJ38_02485 [Candidatus Bathyarchaeota archaeon]|jgi:hypothetical protein
MPTPDWARCHVEIYEAPGFLDDCFRSSLWTVFQSAASQSFIAGRDVTGDLACMTVTEGGTPSGCGYRKDLSGKSLNTDDYPRFRVRVRGRGTTPQYKVGIKYNDTNVTETGWINAPSDMTVDVLDLDPGKTIKYVKLYAGCNTASGTAYIDYDYAAILRNPPLVPTENMEVDVDLWSTLKVSGAVLKMLNDVLLGVTECRYTLEAAQGSIAFDLSRGKGHAALTSTAWDSGGRHGYCLYFGGTARMETGYKPAIPATGAITISFWVKAAPGASGVVCGFGQTNATWNRVQFNWSGDKIRLYVKDDDGNILQQTSTVTVADNGWHLVTGIIDPDSDSLQLYVDGGYEGGDSGTLETITIDNNDLTWGCLHTDGGFSNYTVCYIDEPMVLSRALRADEVRELYIREPLSGAARAGPGALVMVYLAADSESQVYKLITARVIDREALGDPDEPVLKLVCEDLGEIMHERTFTEEYATATQISSIVDDISDQALPELFHDIDTTSRTLVNRFSREGVFSLLEKLAETASFITGETGANFYVDPGGALRFKRYGAFNCALKVSDGSDGSPANILDIRVRESMKGEPRLVNDVEVVIFEEETVPRDEDGWTEAADSWSSPDPTDANYPQSETGDKKSGTACIKFQTTNPGSQYHMRHESSEIDLTGVDEIRFWFKYGSGLSPDNLEVKMQKGSWAWTSDYYIESGLSVPSADDWYEYAIDISDFGITGTPGAMVARIQIRAYRSSGDLGTGGFKIDKLRFVRVEKKGTANDPSSQDEYGKRTLRMVDKTITDTGYAGYIAGNIVEHRKTPVVSVEAVVPGRAQPGYRPPMMVSVSSLKDGLDGETFQIQRARHHYSPGRGYRCTLELVAARKPDGSYEAKVAPVHFDLAAMPAALRRRQMAQQLNSLRSAWI